MKKFVIVVLLCALVIGVAGCGNSRRDVLVYRSSIDAAANTAATALQQDLITVEQATSILEYAEAAKTELDKLDVAIREGLPHEDVLYNVQVAVRNLLAFKQKIDRELNNE
jgi:hypothetical protein